MLRPAARWVAEYYPVEDLHADDDGSARVTMRYGDRDWMVRLLLGLGDAVEVLAPAGPGRGPPRPGPRGPGGVRRGRLTGIRRAPSTSSPR